LVHPIHADYNDIDMPSGRIDEPSAIGSAARPLYQEPAAILRVYQPNSG
jgi:hypothetical protein